MVYNLSEMLRWKGVISVKKESSTNSKSAFLPLCKAILIFAPLIIFVLIYIFVVPFKNGAFIFSEIIGLIMLLSGTAMLLISKHDRKLSVILIAFGTVISICNMLPMFITPLQSIFTANFISFYYVIWVIMGLTLLWYAFFRYFIKNRLKDCGISNSKIKKSLSGARGFWWYDRLHREYNIGFIYYFNKVFTLIYGSALLLHLSLGWLKPILIFDSVLLILVVLFFMIMDLFSTAQFEKEEFRSKFVLIKSTGKSKKWLGYSGVPKRIGIIIFSLTLIYAIIRFLIYSL